MRREEINNVKYATILYITEMLEDDIESLKSTLKSGITVHLFLTNTLIDELDLNDYNNDFFDNEINNKLLFIYENQDQISESNEVICNDNIIYNQKLYNKLCGSENSEFNKLQYEIITADANSNYIVISGAGTGKTTTMINRLIYLRNTKDNFTFDKAALITFTNKSSIEMKERLIQILERYYKVTNNNKYLDMMDEAANCTISTIHSFSKKLINQYGKIIEINKNIKVKSFKYDRRRAITEALNHLFKNYKELYKSIKYYQHYEIEDRFLKLWDKLDNYSIDVNSDKYTVDFGVDEKNFSKIIKIVLSKAQELLDKNKDENIEITDLTKKLSYKEMFYGAKDDYELIMVDEFQDSDNIQIEFVVNFCNIVGAKLLVVGDEKQSIYRFRGAESSAFYRLREELKLRDMSFKEFTMVRNYRTNSNLLKEINEIFINVNDRVDKFKYEENDYIYSLIDKDNKTKIEYIDIKDLDKEAADFYDTLLNSIDKKKKESVAVLMRSNSDIKEFKEFCDRNSILCRTYVSGNFYRHESVRDFYIMIKALLETNTNSVKYAFVETPYINKVIDKEKILAQDREDVSNYLEDILKEKGWRKYQNLINEINILELIDLIIKDLNPIKGFFIKEYYKAKINNRDAYNTAKVKTLEYRLNLEYLLFILKENFSDNISSIFAIEKFLKLKISTDTIVDERKPRSYDEEYLHCLTVHKAKGLEYDYVIMPKLTKKFITTKDVDVIVRSNKTKVDVGFRIKLGESDFKNSNYNNYLKDENSEIIGEEARILYVAMTRCKKKLYINSSGLTATEGLNNWKSLIGGARTYV